MNRLSRLFRNHVDRFWQTPCINEIEFKKVWINGCSDNIFQNMYSGCSYLHFTTAVISKDDETVATLWVFKPNPSLGLQGCGPASNDITIRPVITKRCSDSC